MADLLGTDEFLVNRNDVTYTQEQSTLMASLEQNDYLLINRAGQTYKITGGDLIDSVVDPLELTVILNPTEGYVKNEITAIPVVSGGKQPEGGYVFTYQWVSADDAAGTNRTPIAGETGAEFTPDETYIGLFVGCVISTTDALGTTAEGEAYVGPMQLLAVPPVIKEVVISEIYDGGNRFTDKEFPYVTTMLIDGEPAPDFGVKAKLSGTTFDFDLLSDAITDVEGKGIYTCSTDPITNVTSEKVLSFDAKGNGQNSGGGSLNIQNMSWDMMPHDRGSNIPVGSNVTNNGVDTARMFRSANPVNAVGFRIGLAGYSGAETDHKFYSSPSGQKDTWTDLGTFTRDDVGKGIYIPEAYGLMVITSAAFTVATYTCTDSDFVVDLTFPSSKGFECFEPGDVVQPAFDYTVTLFKESSSSVGTRTTKTGEKYRLRTTELIGDESQPDRTFAQYLGLDNGQLDDSVRVEIWGHASLTSADGAQISGWYPSDWNTPYAIANLKAYVGYGTYDYITITECDDTSYSNGEDIKELHGVDSLGAKVISKDEENNIIVVDGGEWTGTDGSGDAGAQTELSKQTPYETKLTLASSQGLEYLSGDVFMTDGLGIPTTQTPYNLTTSDIESTTDNTATNYQFMSGTVKETNWNDASATTYNIGDAIVAGDAETCLVKGSSGVKWGLNDPAYTSTTPSIDISVSDDGLLWQDLGMFSWFQLNLALGNGFVMEKQYFRAYIAGRFTFSVWSVWGADPRVELTFADPNPDLRYFLPGDAVQRPSKWNEGPWVSYGFGDPYIDGDDPLDWNYTFDGKSDPQYQPGISSSGNTFAKAGGTMTWLPPGAGLEVTDRVDFYTYSVTNNSTFGLRVNSSIWLPDTPSYGTKVTLTAAELGGILNKVELINDNSLIGPYLSGIAVDGQFLVDPRYVDDTSPSIVKVVSTDVANNTMVVNGGEWASSIPGADQTREWSAGAQDSNYRTGRGWKEVFNGRTEVVGEGLVVEGAGVSSTLVFDPPISGSLKVYGGAGSSTNTGTSTLTTSDGKTFAIGQYLSSQSDQVPAQTVSNCSSITVTSQGTASGELAVVGGLTLNGILLADPAGHVEYQTNGGQGSVVKADLSNSTLMVNDSGDRDNRWIAGNYGEGSGSSINFYVAPSDGAVIAQDHAWCQLQTIDDKAQVITLLKDEPDFLLVRSKDYSIKFPALLPSGNEPDDDLPKGVCIAAIVEAENTEGRDDKESNCLMPNDVNPDGAAGPITDSTPTTLTLASGINLDEFAQNDQLVMVNEDNEVSSYTMQTSTIGSVAQATSFSVRSDDTSNDYDNTYAWSTADGVIAEVDIPGYFSTGGGNHHTLHFFTPGTGHTVYVAVGGYFVYQLFSSTTGEPGSYTKVGDYTVDQIHNNEAKSPEQYSYLTNGGLNGQGYWGVSGSLNALTFTVPNPDLKFFRPGDVVQSNTPFDMEGGTATVDKPLEVGVGGSPGTSADPNVVMNGVIDIDNSISVAAGNLPVNITCYPNKAVPGGKLVTIYYLYGNTPNTVTSDSKPILYSVNGKIVNLTGSSPIVNETISAAGIPYSVIKFPTEYGDITNFVIQFVNTNTGNPVLYGFTAEADPAADVKVVDTDLVNNTMVVDGGEWDPDGLNGDSEVTYGPVTGTGTFQSPNPDGTSMTLSVSNDRWIDTSNRLGLNFYCRENITVLNADNPKHVAMQQAIADAFNSYPAKVEARRTAVLSSFTRLTNGESLSAEEVAILQDIVSRSVE